MRFQSPSPVNYDSGAWKKKSTVKSTGPNVILHADRVKLFDEAQAISGPGAKYKIINYDKVLSKRVKSKKKDN